MSAREFEMTPICMLRGGKYGGQTICAAPDQTIAAITVFDLGEGPAEYEIFWGKPLEQIFVFQAAPTVQSESIDMPEPPARPRIWEDRE